MTGESSWSGQLLRGTADRERYLPPSGSAVVFELRPHVPHGSQPVTEHGRRN